MDMERIYSGICGTLALVFGIYAIVTNRVQFGDEGDDAQVWLYGWRAIAIGFVALAVAVLFFVAAFGFIRLNWV